MADRDWTRPVVVAAAVVLAPVRWLAADPHRALTLAWLVGLLLVGHARLAAADGIIVGPDLAGGAPKTLFETYDVTAYKLTVRPDEETSGWFDMGAGVLQIVGFVNNLLLWACLGVLYGALTLLEWFLNLTIYRDAAAQLDAAVALIAAQVFWPLISATVAIGAFIAYARWRGEGRGYLADLGWVLAAAALGIGFAAGPSTIINGIDGARQDLAAGIMTGSAQYATTAGNPVGFPQPTIGGEPKAAATRRLVDSIWNTFGATTWCYAQFHELDICRAAGAHALANDAQWQEWMRTLDRDGAVPEFREYGDWVRGQDVTRTGVLLLLALITLPAGVVLLRLVVAGLVAVVGLILMLIIALLFLTFWPIPGWFRETGTRYAMFTLGYELQALFLTVTITGVMVGSTIIATLSGSYGFFVVAVLNLALLVAGMRARSWLDLLTTSGGANAMGLATVLLLRSAVRTVASAGAGTVTGTLGLATGGSRAVGTAMARAGRGPGWTRQSGAWHIPWGTRGGSVPAGWLAGLDGGPVPATATRMPTPGRPALPAGPASPRGRSRPTTGPARPGGGAAPHRNGATPRAGSTRDRAGKGGGGGRVWMDHRGSGLSSLDKMPPPRPAARRGGAYQITTAAPQQRRRQGGQGRGR